ncbi:hypothetical protein BMG03_00980 [Thioclava nitratireducens]|uniref:Uncharacterized protein n=1 Tax=Thioclava nitratireducens TaxID=1915078 RepID=A0ABM6ID20_9RHOB|nr:hypothetical protein [Thioclava nitratireducens]AQS46529.1 hypothetical protein BMG03_00980 [Thioclava nitratireducens]
MDDARKTYEQYAGVPVSVLYELEDILRESSSLYDRQVTEVSRCVLAWMVDRELLPVPAKSATVGISLADVTCELDPLRHQEIAREFRQVLVGRCAPSIDPQSSPLAEQLAPESEAEDLPPEPTSSADGGAVAGNAAPEAGAEAATSAPSGEVVMGPLSDHEKAVMASARLQGRPAADVAADLNRRLQTVAIYMSKLPSGVNEPEQNTDRPAEPLPKPTVAVAQDQGPDPDRREEPAGSAEVVAGTSEPAEHAPTPTTDRSIEAHLDAIGQKGGWTTSRDIVLIEGLAKGIDKALMADQLGVEVGEIMARFRALVPGGKFESMEHQRKLMQVLRARYEREA